MLQNGVSQFCVTLIRRQAKNCYLLQLSSCTIAITDRNASSCDTAGEQPSGCVKNLGGLAPSGRLLRHDIDPKALQPAYDSLNGSVSPDAATSPLEQPLDEKTLKSFTHGGGADREIVVDSRPGGGA